MNRALTLASDCNRIFAKHKLCDARHPSIHSHACASTAPPAGATYPVDKETETEFLRALGEPNGAGAAVVGEPGARRLSGVDVAATSYFLTSSVVGIARS